ncbi:TM2 domain-containing protein [bacterium]|nr:TM2 domain-containing protein [bacterium]
METEVQNQAETQTQAQAEVKTAPAETEKTFVVAILLCLFLGGFGAHRFYVGKKNSAIGILALSLGGIITFGLTSIAASVWVLVDLVQIILGNFKTADGKDLVR